MKYDSRIHKNNGNPHDTPIAKVATIGNQKCLMSFILLSSECTDKFIRHAVL
ncbi:MAG: hypothetical protein MJK04_25475 [Psychrosphaera sp.]|nr:hypothetical protein [Psychrosphaera sp.]